MKTTTLPIRNPICHSRRPALAGLLIPLVFAWFALSPAAQALNPPPDGDYFNENTAEGQDALFHLISGSGNTAIGFDALFSNTNGAFNTATGFSALSSNTTGGYNTANGTNALDGNTTGFENTANGFEALLHNNADFNTANGALALRGNTTGGNNTANGFEALRNNTTGGNNTANGVDALYSNTSGSNNTANGLSALFNNTTGGDNIALGVLAGANLTKGSNNIDIGNLGVAAEANTIRIGKQGTQKATFIAGIIGAPVAGVTVHINGTGQLGIGPPSSVRFKEQIKPMDKASEAILALKPVTFRYKPELDPDGIPQFGLVAEEVEKVNPDLVARDDQGKVYTVRYDVVNAMLLNEFLKEHRTVQELKSTAARQEATIGELKSTVGSLAVTVKEQAAQIQKVSAELEVQKAPAETVVNNQ